MKWKSLIKKYAIFVSIVVLFFLIDFLLKHFLYNSEKAGTNETLWNIKILAGRSLLHKSTTFLDFLNISAPFWVMQMLAWILVIVLFSICYFVKNYYLLFNIGLILSGILGNTLDQIFHYENGQSGVRDIFFFPWHNDGTFNFADVMIIMGSAFSGLAMVINYFKEKNKDKKGQGNERQKNPATDQPRKTETKK